MLKLLRLLRLGLVTLMQRNLAIALIRVSASLLLLNSRS